MTLLADNSVIEACAVRLLERVGLAGPLLSVQPLPGGRNNQVYRVESSAGTFLLKRYFHHPSDSRDRIGQETAFLSHLERVGCRAAPRLIASDRESHTALMEFIEGRRILLETVGETEVEQALAFVLSANPKGSQEGKRRLPNASEACFSIKEHLERTQRRVDRLAQITREDEVDEAAAAFVRDDLLSTWRNASERIAAGWPNETERARLLPDDERCLSPSDFGFHNALREAAGRIRFLDFEYAGWDDPAKLICDFANQPDLLLNRTLAERFSEGLTGVSRNAEDLRRRVQALEPLYQIKWACICLNDFLAPGHSRHRFVGGTDFDHRARREFQLGRARVMLARAKGHFFHMA